MQALQAFHVEDPAGLVLDGFHGPVQVGYHRIYAVVLIPFGSISFYFCFPIGKGCEVCESGVRRTGKLLMWVAVSPEECVHKGILNIPDRNVPDLLVFADLDGPPGSIQKGHGVFS
jgi:hypothetical protein